MFSIKKTHWCRFLRCFSLFNFLFLIRQEVKNNLLTGQEPEYQRLIHQIKKKWNIKSREVVIELQSFIIIYFSVSVFIFKSIVAQNWKKKSLFWFLFHYKKKIVDLGTILFTSRNKSHISWWLQIDLLTLTAFYCVTQTGQVRWS